MGNKITEPNPPSIFSVLTSHAVFTPLLLILSFTLHSAHSSLTQLRRLHSSAPHFDLFFNLAPSSAIFAGPTSSPHRCLSSLQPRVVFSSLFTLLISLQVFFFKKKVEFGLAGWPDFTPNSGWVGKSQPELRRVGSGLSPLHFGSGWASPFKAGWPKIPALFVTVIGVYGKSIIIVCFLEEAL